jgi:hypothetical protein
MITEVQAFLECDDVVSRYRGVVELYRQAQSE